MSHIVISCTCRDREDCPVPGHGVVPLEVDPNVLVEAGEEALVHLKEVERHLIAARAAWMSRGLPGDNPFPLSIDRQTESFIASRRQFQAWVKAAAQVAAKRADA